MSLIKKWMEEENIKGFTGTEHSFAMFLFEDKPLSHLLAIGGHFKIFESVCRWVKKSREYINSNKSNHPSNIREEYELYLKLKEKFDGKKTLY